MGHRQNGPAARCPPCYRRQSVPGIGTSLALGLRYAMQDVDRFPRGQDVLSYCRGVKGSQAAAGKRDGPSGAKLGQASLKWACSAAAVLCFRDHLAGQKSLARLAQKHGQGKAWTLLAPQRARAVYSLRQRDTACELQKVLHGSGSGAGEPQVSRERHGMRLKTAL
jgi:hypothetical protein